MLKIVRNCQKKDGGSADQCPRPWRSFALIQCILLLQSSFKQRSIKVSIVENVQSFTATEDFDATSYHPVGHRFLRSRPPRRRCPEKLAAIEGVTEYRLANGAGVLLFPEPSRPTITVNMTVLVGSRHEGYGETGMAHLLEHMVFKGHADFPGRAESTPRSRGQFQWHHER